MSPHAPPHLRDIARVLMAGEDVKWMAKPNIGLLVMLEVVVAAGSFVVLLVAFMIFSGLPMAMEAVFALIAALAGVVILHMTIGLRKYVVTDQRLLVITPFTRDVHDSCELRDITSVRNPRFTRSLIVERSHGRPIRLWALADKHGAIEAMHLSPDVPMQLEDPDQPEKPEE